MPLPAEPCPTQAGSTVTRTAPQEGWSVCARLVTGSLRFSQKSAWGTRIRLQASSPHCPTGVPAGLPESPVRWGQE